MISWLGPWAEGLWNWVVIILFLTLALWETLKPARAARSGTALRWFTNISLYAVNATLLAVLVPAAIAETLLGGIGSVPRPFALLGGSAGEWGILIVGFLTLDLYAYLIHRAQHHVFVFWRFHSVHHSDAEMDASTTLRHHPMEYLASSAVGASVFVVLGIPEWVFPVYALVGIVVSLIQHVNAGRPGRLDHALQWVIVTPGMHQIHHSVAAEDFEANYGTVLSVWDRMFGTYRQEPSAGRDAMAFGVTPFTTEQYASLHWAWLLPFALRRPPADVIAGSHVD